MVWSNWQGAISRGAVLVLLFWAGLAWTQAPERPAADPAERIMVVHENGKSTRCRVLESWQLPDGRVAHLLEALDTGERITIVDDQLPSGEHMTNPRAMPKRIFSWGLGRKTPPEGSPIPPHLRQDSGVVIKNQTPPPVGAVPKEGPAIINRVDDQVIGGSAPTPTIPNDSALRPNTKLFPRLFPKLEKPADAQVVDFQKKTPREPLVINEQPRVSDPILTNPSVEPAPLIGKTPGVRLTPGLPLIEPTPRVPRVVLPSNPSSGIPQTETNPTTIGPVISEPAKPDTQAKSSWRPGANLNTWLYGNNTPKVNGPKANDVPITKPLVIGDQPKESNPLISKPLVETTPAPGSLPTNPNLGNRQIETNPAPIGPVIADPGKADTQTKKPWRFGANLHGWLHGKSAPKADDGKKAKKTEDYLTAQNKVAEKQLAGKIEKITKSPFSTAMLAPDAKKPEPSPLAIPNPAGPKEEKPLVLPPPETGRKPELKPDMWGSDAGRPMLSPGKSLLDQIGVKPELVKLPPPPQGRVNDPLMSPERLIPRDDKGKPKGVAPPIARNDTPPVARNDFPLVSRPVFAPPPPEFATTPGIPLGTQSVLAAKNGLLGPVTYVPVPTVTVPQPHNPPQPPPPQLPDVPNLNAHVNGFTPPPAPKAPQQVGWQHSGAFSNPLSQQQILAQQQQMLAQQQQMLAQQAMMQYGYATNPCAMNPYMQQYRMQPMMAQGPAYGYQMPTHGPMTNFSRQYSGPMAPNPFAGNAGVQMGFAPQGYGYQAPMQAMVQQQPQYQPTTQQVSHQQMPTQTQPVGQQVEQLIKVLRESPFPAQREWAAQSLTSYEWRANPQIVPALLQSASQDPAAGVRAGCVYCLGRMGAAVEPVFGALHSLRNDIDPRVRAEVEQTFTRLGQTPMLP